MKVTILVDNNGTRELKGEWGLSAFIEYNGKNILLDAGGSDLFVKNAEKLGKDLSAVDYAVLSHNHYDHGDGIPYFFEENDKAKFLVRNCECANCYSKVLFINKYIGTRRDVVKTHPDRLAKVSGDYRVDEGIYLIPHKTPGLEKIGKREKMYLKTADGWRPDDFAHEQSLVFRTEKGLVVFNSSSHGGAATIIKEVSETFPGEKVHAMIGGFHLYNKSKRYVRDFAQAVKDTGIEYICTGHCTGDKAYRVLEKELGDICHRLQTGLAIEF